MADVELCSKCGKKKRRHGLTSFTQWIFDIESCACERFSEAVDEQFSKKKSFCATCGLPISSGRAGSMTQWIFVSGSCSCASPVPAIDDSTNSNIEVDNRDQAVYENEQELVINDETLPKERYKVLHELGRGASGIVYLCRDRLLGKKVAVKTLRRLTNEQLIAFQTEARATSKLTHPAILGLLDFGPGASGAPYMVLEYFDGVSLEKYLESNFILPISHAISVFEDLTDALSVAHQAGIFHRDLKPSNVLIRLSETEKPLVKLIDFGVARVKEETASSSEIQGMTLAGTPMYMAPDNFAGGVYDARSEVYSLGCLIFHCLTGRPPFFAETALDLMRKHVEMTPPSLAEVYSEEGRGSGSEFPSSLEIVISKCLRKNPDDRYSSMQELKRALTNLSNFASQATTIDGGSGTSRVHLVEDKQNETATKLGKRLSIFIEPKSIFLSLFTTMLIGCFVYKCLNGGLFDIKPQAKFERNNSSPGIVDKNGKSEPIDETGNFMDASRRNGHSTSDTPEQPIESKQMENLEQIVKNEADLQRAANKGDANAAFQLSEIYFKRGKTDPEDWKKSMFWVRKAADRGHSAAINNIGFLYEHGLGVKQDYAEAAKWYQKSVERNNYVAKSNLGRLYQEGIGVPLNRKLAIKLITEAAENGDATAQNNLGYAYLHGNGAPRDYRKACFWIERSAKQGYPEALSNLAYIYDQGRGVKQDYQKAVKFYQLAARQSNSTAINNLGNLYQNGQGVRQDYTKAMELFRQAATLGNKAALANIGNLYADGKGVRKDQAEALTWLRKAAQYDEPIALNNLGYAYMEGRGVPVDYKKAMNLFRRSAEGRFAMANHNIGWMYQCGFGVKRDYKEALKWFRKAADDNCALSINQIGFFYKVGLGVEKDYKKAKDYFIMAAERGEAQGFENLAEMYENGYGVPVDYATTIKFRRKAMILGSPEAFHNMALLYEKGAGVPQSSERAEKLFIKAAEMGCAAAKEELRKLYARGHGGRQSNRSSR